MAKKRAMSRSSSRSRKKSSGGGSGWKNSPIVKVVLIVVIIGCLLNLLYSLTSGGGSNNPIPDDFPRTFIAASDNGSYNAVIIKRSKTPPKTPILEGGKEYWDAYICLNEKCPGRKITGGKPFIFAAVMQTPPNQGNGPETPPMDVFMDATCPECKVAYNKVSKEYKSLFDPINVQRYQTEEALKIIEQIREKFKKKR